MRNGDGFLCVYSITSRTSFEELEIFRDQILRVKDTDRCPMIIIGNKSDLNEYREVQEQTGREFAKKSNALFMETSYADPLALYLLVANNFPVVPRTASISRRLSTPL